MIEVASNTGKSFRIGAQRERSQTQNPKTGLWTKRDTDSGRFTDTKTSSGRFKGVRREK